MRGEVRGHGVFDGLIDRLCCESLGVPVPYLPRCNHKDHGGRGERVEAYGGKFYAAAPEGPLEVSVGSRLSTRVAVNRQRRVAEEQMLYSPLVLDETTFDDTGDKKILAETTFHGGVVVGEAARPLVPEAATSPDCPRERCRMPALLHVRASRSRGP